jgi:hypothetical protein
MDAYQMSLRTDGSEDDLPPPDVQQECPATFGNSDIFGTSINDPT